MRNALNTFRLYRRTPAPLSLALRRALSDTAGGQLLHDVRFAMAAARRAWAFARTARSGANPDSIPF